MVINSNEIFNSFYLIKPVIKINFIKNEIINNLPKINISENYLFIHIRSGDAFKNKKPHKDYAQPPLCFYISILQNYKFQKVYILSENNNNPNTEHLNEVAILTGYNVLDSVRFRINFSYSNFLNKSFFSLLYFLYIY